MKRNKKKVRRMVKHHITNRCKGGKNVPSNLILLKENREKAWHQVFGNKSFEEVIELLQRVCKIKGRNL
jgi:hypothetical protein